MKKLLLLIFAALCPLAHATITQPILIPKITFVDASGNPCAGCTLTSYIAGTTTALATFTNAAGSSSNTNPIVLDAAGGATIWLGQTAYKFVLKDASGGTIWTVDQVVSLTTLGCLGANAIDHGCTGATTSQGAATNIVDGNTIKPSNVLNANVNGVFTITKYGAVGDCAGSGATTACTDNHAAIQAAIDAAYPVNGAVYLPANPSNVNTQTVYYVSLSIDPKGVSMYGPPGGSGPGNFYPTTNPVAVRGAPGKDVFATLDPVATGYVVPHVSFAMRDFTVLVDDSVDASASFPYREPGRICWDVVGNGTAVVTSAAQCIFQPGDVGQAITAGATTTTILSYQSATQVTLNATVLAGTGVSAYISVMGMPVTQNIGNCGFAMPDNSGAASAVGGPFHTDFTNFNIQSISNNGLNNSCGFFFQGNNAPTWTRWQNVTAVANWPMWFVPQNQSAPSNSTQWGGINDFDDFKNVTLAGKYPFGMYSASFGSIERMQIYGAWAGPQFLTAYNIEGAPHNWSIDIPEMEPITGCPALGSVLRLSGYSHTLEHFSGGLCSASILQWDASFSTAKEFAAYPLSAFNITGTLNSINWPKNGDWFGLATTTDTGSGNQVITGSSSNPYGGSQPGRQQYTGGLAGNVNTFGGATLSHGGYVFNRDSSFVNKGASAYYFNDQDLWFWPNELLQDAGGALVPVADSTSETGQYIPIASNDNQSFNGTNTHDWFIGSQIPAGKFRVYARIASAASTSDWAMYVQANTGSFTDIGTCSGPTAAGTTYQTISCDADATGLAGDAFRLIFYSETQAGKIAWVGIRPFDTDLVASGVSVLGSYAPKATGTNGSFTIGIDGTIDEDVTTGALNDNTPTTVALPLALPTALDSCVCSENGTLVQSGNPRTIGCNAAAESAPIGNIYVTASGASSFAYCRVRGH